MPSKPAAKKSSTDFQYDRQFRDVPATQGMLDLVRTELKSEVQALRSETKAGFATMDARFSSMDAKIDKMLILMEEQRSENRVALEGLTGLWQRQARLEFRMNDTESLVGSIARSAASASGAKES